ncbi:unnamed protein product [Prorocentrum cordatum]|uniref:MGS-like domain-containing protein n=1 Tax=Prorocentrum cordatum TaxID=2364126 RepID=A0ABN9TGC6_9DINO|nr:unnamed protein product [Polarella glacialis]
MASWFGMGDPDESSVYGITEVWDDDLEKMVPVLPTDVVYSCFRALSMGFTWALHLCHSAVEHLVAAGVPRDRVPRVSFVSPITSTYVDNAALLSANAETSDLREVLRIWIGHVVHLFMLNRPALSCLWTVYQFILHALDRRCRVWGSLRQEIKVIMGLVFLCQRDLGASRLRMAYCSDSSDLGYCLAVTSASDAELREAAAYHERWLFVEERVDRRCELVPYLELCERWKTLFERKWADPTEHINTKEGRVMLTGTEKTNGGLRYLGQRAAALPIGCAIQWATRHLEGVRNPTDAGSRRFDSGSDPTLEATNLGLERGGHDMAIVRAASWRRPVGTSATSARSLRGCQCSCSYQLLDLKGLPYEYLHESHYGALFCGRYQGCYDRALYFVFGTLWDFKWASYWDPKGLEISKGPEYDLLDPGIRQYLVKLLQSGQILCVWLGTPCSALSIARRQRLARPPAVRHGPAPQPRNPVERSVAPSTLHTYKAEVAEFRAWAAGRGLGLRTPEAADSAMSDNFDWLFAQREQPQAGRWTLHGYALLHLSHLGRGGHVLPRAKAALRGWIRQMPGRIRDPCPIEAAWLIAQWMLLKNQAFYFWCSLAVVMQVNAYVRPSALLDIKKKDLLPPLLQRGSRYVNWGLALAPSTRTGKTKSGEQDDTLIIGILDRAFVKDVAAFLHSSFREGERIFRHLTLPSYEKAVKDACEALELQSLRIVPHCFRHTGPSTDADLKVACFGVNQYEAFLKAMIATGFKIPMKNILISIGPAQQKNEFLNSAPMLVDMGFQLYATKNTHAFLRQAGIESAILVYKPRVKREPNVLTLLQQGKLDLVINVPDSMDSQALTDGFDIRRAAVDGGTSLITDIKTATLTIMSMHRKWTRETSGRHFWSYSSWKEYTEPNDILQKR